MNNIYIIHIKREVIMTEKEQATQDNSLYHLINSIINGGKKS